MAAHSIRKLAIKEKTKRCKEELQKDMDMWKGGETEQRERVFKAKREMMEIFKKYF